MPRRALPVLGGGAHVQDGLAVGSEPCVPSAWSGGTVLGHLTQFAAVGLHRVDVAPADVEVTGRIGGADDRGPVGGPVRIAAAHLPGRELFDPGAVDVDCEYGGVGVRALLRKLVIGGSPAVEDQLAPIR